MAKLKNEAGEIAVLVSRGYGAGWYSWNTSIKECLFDRLIVEHVLAGNRSAAQSLAEILWPDGYWGGADGLEVHWLSPDTVFRIDEYHGSETLVFADDQTWIVVPSSEPSL